MTDTMLTGVGLMTLEEFILRQNEDEPFELLDGEIVAKMPNVASHALTIKRLFVALLRFEDKGIEVFSETTFVLLYETHWVKGSRIPDLMVYKSERLRNYYETTPDWESKPFALVPDLVVEVVSPTDKYSDIDARVERYLEDGVKVVWVTDPQQRKAAVHRAGSAQQTNLVVGDTLTEDEIVPDFVLSLVDLFEKP